MVTVVSLSVVLRDLVLRAGAFDPNHVVFGNRAFL